MICWPWMFRADDSHGFPEYCEPYMFVLTGDGGNMELWRDTSEPLRESGESMAGDSGGEYTDEGFLGEVDGDVCELLPRRALQVGHNLTNLEISSFGTLSSIPLLARTSFP